MRVDWKAHALNANGHQMAWFEVGEGMTLVCLHGSVDHLLYRPMGQLFAQKYRCVLYDQRGSGKSTVPELNDETMDIWNFVEDLEVLRDHLQLEKMALLGHSWGCALGLLYAQRHPERLSHLVLVGPGPLSAEMSECYRANRDRMAYPVSADEFGKLRREFEDGRKSQSGVPRDIDEALFRAWAPAMFYSREHVDSFVDAYLQAGGYRRIMRDAANFERKMQLAEAEKITAPTLVVYGYQDYEPITQAYMIKDRIPQSEIAFLNRCGHMTWVDQPDEYFKVVHSFLTQDRNGN